MPGESRPRTEGGSHVLVYRKPGGPSVRILRTQLISEITHHRLYHPNTFVSLQPAATARPLASLLHHERECDSRCERRHRRNGCNGIPSTNILAIDAFQAVTYPLITLSTRAQVDAKGEHRSIKKALKKILDEEGVQGLYSGLKSALFGIGITNGTALNFKETNGGKGSTIFGMSGVKRSLRIER